MSTTTAIRAESFMQSIGVNTHIGRAGTPYTSISLIEQELSYLGIDRARDYQPLPSTMSDYEQLAAFGVKYDLIYGGGGENYPSATSTYTPYLNTLEDAHPGSIYSIEGPNELNGAYPVYYNGVSSDTNGTITDEVMQAIYASLKGDGTLSSIPLLNASLGGSSDYLTIAEQEGNMSAYLNGANYHVYPTGGEQPGGGNDVLSYAASLALMTAPGLPLTFTETGYPTAYGVSGSNDVDQTVQADNILNELADAYQLGAQQTYLYELMDESANPAPGNDEQAFGLFTSTGTPKLAATAIHNLVSILSDNAANAQTFTTGSLAYIISGLPSSTGNSMLLEKSTGAFDLMLWNETADWNPTTQTEIPAATVNTTVTFGQVEGAVEVFDPLQGSTPIATYTDINSVTVGLTDHPEIVEVEPPGTTPPPSPTSDTLTLNLSETDTTISMRHSICSLTAPRSRPRSV